jgi:hypothetical protein
MALHSPCGILDIYAPASSVRGLGASFSEPRYRARGAAELSGFAVANAAAGHHIGVPKGAQSEMVIFLTISRYRPLMQKFVVWFHWHAASPVNRKGLDCFSSLV